MFINMNFFVLYSFHFVFTNLPFPYGPSGSQSVGQLVGRFWSGRFWVLGSKNRVFGGSKKGVKKGGFWGFFGAKKGGQKRGFFGEKSFQNGFLVREFPEKKGSKWVFLRLFLVFGVFGLISGFLVWNSGFWREFPGFQNLGCKFVPEKPIS